MWNDMCRSERAWLREKNVNEKMRKRRVFISKRKEFDKQVKHFKRQYKKRKDDELLEMQSKDQREFWRKIGHIGISQDRQNTTPLEVKLDDGSVSDDLQTVLKKWQADFSNLLNPVTINDDDTTVREPLNTTTENAMTHDPELNREITNSEFMKVINKAKNNKAPGHDDIPIDVLKNESAIQFLLRLFNTCLQTGKVPSQWSKYVLNPIPKSSTVDKRDPLSYRGIALAPASYKLFCGILNNRLIEWAETNNILADEQNGLRKGRSTVDHISSLVNIVETRKLKRKQTFAAFVDFRKAYDSINRSLLWSKLEDLGIGGKILHVIREMYRNTEYCVRVNGLDTDWFQVTTGLKQGCMLSPLLFNLFINNLVENIKSLNIGIDIGEEKVSLLLYADDLVLLSENENDMQILLDTLSAWCRDNKLQVNENKSNIIHFRTPSVQRTSFKFSCCEKVLSVTNQYNYLGLLLTEFLDLNIMASAVAKSASRALGLVIYKCKSNGGFPYQCFTKLYDSLVWPIIDYGSSIWETTKRSCIEAVQNRACRFFMGVGKYTPNLAVQGDMGWTPVLVKQWKSIGRLWARFNEMSINRLNKRILIWSLTNSSTRCKNWAFRVKFHMAELGLEYMAQDDTNFSKAYIVNKMCETEFDLFKRNWKNELDKINRPNGSRSKLRTYCSFKQSFGTETYLSISIPKHHRSALAKFRCGVAPIRLERGRYEKLPEEERKCFACDSVENECHVICECPVYDDLRNFLFSKASDVIQNFNSLDSFNKMCTLLSNCDTFKITAKTLSDILIRRRSLIYR